MWRLNKAEARSFWFTAWRGLGSAWNTPRAGIHDQLKVACAAHGCVTHCKETCSTSGKDPKTDKIGTCHIPHDFRHGSQASLASFRPNTSNPYASAHEIAPIKNRCPPISFPPNPARPDRLDHCVAAFALRNQTLGSHLTRVIQPYIRPQSVLFVFYFLNKN
ncbi:Uncharacterized protein HZ326_22220 [Fusarium oxysporum f. sp. albedinis]|nr:Uncharacterized protein HZ326_22220 [Fusarium oxysporum f. sp. albedinis]